MPSILFISSKWFVVRASLLEATIFWSGGIIFWATRPKPRIEIKTDIRTIKPRDFNFKLKKFITAISGMEERILIAI